MKRTRESGFSLIELMVAVVVMTVAMAGVGAWFASYRAKMTSEDINAALQAQLRGAMDMVGFSLRNAGYGVPQNPNLWTTWPSTEFVIRTQNTGNPVTLSVLSCTTSPTGLIQTAALPGATSLSIAPTDNFEVDVDRVFLVGDLEHVVGRRIDLNTLKVTVDPSGQTAVGLLNNYGRGTPLCRLDALLYEIDTSKAMLTRRRQGDTAATPVMEGIVNMDMASVLGANGRRIYTVTLTARSNRPDPLSGQVVQRTLASQFIGRN